MPIVHRAGNLRFMIYLEDHGPPHVHVFSAGAEAKILLGPLGGLPLLARKRCEGSRFRSGEFAVGGAGDAGTARQAVGGLASHSRFGGSPWLKVE
jgi:hypothetical protein